MPIFQRFHYKYETSILAAAYVGVKQQLLHQFCAQCGSSVWHDPRLSMLGEDLPDIMGVNMSLMGI